MTPPVIAIQWGNMKVSIALSPGKARVNLRSSQKTDFNQHGAVFPETCSLVHSAL